jgi:manganese-dependent ADP-ribose/CDP-alcohol diphosphatase
MRQRFLACAAFIAFLVVLGLRASAVEPRPLDARPVFSFGLMTDVQYADKPNRQRMYYRSTLGRLRECVTELNRHPLHFTIQLGDLMDGYVQPDKTQRPSDVRKSQRDLDRVLSELGRLDTKLYHVVGNHCLRAGRETLHKKLGIDRGYYDFVPRGVEGWRMVVLDSMGIEYGELGKEQTEWLEATLARAGERNERVIIFNHFPLLKETTTRYDTIFVDNQPAIRSILDRSGCVAAYFAGHDHAAAYAKDLGIHHVTFPAMAEANKSNAYAIVDVFADRIDIRGFGKTPSRTLRLTVPDSCATTAGNLR